VATAFAVAFSRDSLTPRKARGHIEKRAFARYGLREGALHKCSPALLRGDHGADVKRGREGGRYKPRHRSPQRV